MMKPFWDKAFIVGRRIVAGFGILLVVLAGLLSLRAVFRGPLAEAATNAYNPSFCLGGWENPEAASGAPKKSEPNGGAAAAYLAPDVFAQIFCGYFPVTPRERLPKSATVHFAFSLSGETVVPEPEEITEEAPVDDSELPEEDAQDEGGSGGGSDETVEETPVEDVPAEETPVEEESSSGDESTSTQEDSSDTESSSQDDGGDAGGDDSSGGDTGASSFFKFFTPTAHAAETAENFLLVSYSFDGVRWYSAGRVNSDNARGFSISVPATTWDDLTNLQVMLAPLPVANERPEVYLESVTLKVEADLTLGEIATDGALAVGGVIGEVLGLADNLELAAVNMIAPPVPLGVPAPPAPPAPVTKLTFAIAGSAIDAEGASGPAPRVAIEDDGLALRVGGDCDQPYYVLLTYRSIKDFEEKPRSFVSNYAGECKGDSFTGRLNHLPIDTPEGTYFLLVAEQGEEGSWTPVTSLLPIEIGHRDVSPTALE